MWIVAGLLIVILVVAIVCRLLEASLKIAAALICLFIIATIAFGDGRSYVEGFSSFFKGGDKVVEYYDEYRKRVDEEGVLDSEAAQEFLDKAKHLNFRNENNEE